MLDDDLGDESGEAMSNPVQLVCFYDSTRELRGSIDECWQELQTSFDDAQGPVELRGVKFAPQNTGLRIDIDAGGEMTVSFYPVLGGIPREELAISASQVLLQMHDDGRGSIDPAQLRTLVEWLLEDILPYVGFCDMDVFDERFTDGTRALILVDTSGQLLELPDSLAGDDWC